MNYSFPEILVFILHVVYRTHRQFNDHFTEIIEYYLSSIRQEPPTLRFNKRKCKIFIIQCKIILHSGSCVFCYMPQYQCVSPYGMVLDKWGM